MAKRKTSTAKKKAVKKKPTANTEQTNNQRSQ